MNIGSESNRLTVYLLTIDRIISGIVGMVF